MTQSRDPRVAIIDIGSNTIKVLVAAPGNPLRELARHTCEVRISRGLGADQPRLREDSMRDALAAVQFLLEKAASHEPVRIRIVATSAVRDAANGQEFADLIRTETGHTLEILSGDDEAHGIGRGAAQDPTLRDQDQFLLADLGGGSLELIVVDHGSTPFATSVPLGAVRLAERFLGDLANPVSTEERQAIETHVRTVITQLNLPKLPPTAPLVVAGGAMTFARILLAHAHGIEYGEIPASVSLNELSRLTDEVCALDRDAREKLEGLPANRADIFPVALITLAELARFTGARQLLHTFFNLRYGLAADTLAELAQ